MRKCLACLLVMLMSFGLFVPLASAQAVLTPPPDGSLIMNFGIVFLCLLFLAGCIWALFALLLWVTTRDR